MTLLAGRRALISVVLAIGLVVALPAGSSGSRVTAAGLPAWNGGISLYRSGVFTTQRSWLWCTAAGVQIVRNIVDHRADHSTAGQRRYFTWMRARNRYDLPLSAGVDPAGWTAGLRHFVDGRYRLVASRTFNAALRSAVTRMRLTNLPVALTVSHGNHGWILTGFRATADPARTSNFTVTSVRVTGPLYGLQSKNGYDMRPNTKLTTAQLKRFFTPWKYAPRRMIWDGRYVSIQPVPSSTTPAAPARTQAQAATPTPVAATAVPTPSASTVVSAPIGTPLSVIAIAGPVSGGSTAPAPPLDEPQVVPSIPTAPFVIPSVFVAVLVAGLAGAAFVGRRGRQPRSG